MNDEVIALENIKRTYNIGQENELEILHGITLSIKKGEFVSIVGSSGAGKSTLMNIIGLLDKPTSGGYFLNGKNIEGFSDNKMSDIRKTGIGFVFQSFNLIQKLTAQKNVELPMLYNHCSASARSKKAKELLEMVDMKDRCNHLPNQLSGGQQQRIAIARAMANNPTLILADEPTGALDTETGKKILDIFRNLNRKQGKTIIIITHSNEIAKETDRIITIGDGKIISDKMENRL